MEKKEELSGPSDNTAGGAVMIRFIFLLRKVV